MRPPRPGPAALRAGWLKGVSRNTGPAQTFPKHTDQSQSLNQQAALLDPRAQKGVNHARHGKS